MPNDDKDQATTSEEQKTGNEAPQAETQAATPPKVEPEKKEAEPKEPKKKLESILDPNKLGILNNVSIAVTIEVGRAQIKIRDLLNLTKGSIIELNKSAGDPVDIYANGKLISIGNIITANGKYCVRLTSVPDSAEIGVEPDGK